jgi:hypothetical protein
VVLMKSDPLDVTRAVVLSKATVRKMKQNLVWASVYNVLAIPVAAGVLYPAYGIMLRPEFSALLMSVSSIIVAVNRISRPTIRTGSSWRAGTPRRLRGSRPSSGTARAAAGSTSVTPVQ